MPLNNQSLEETVIAAFRAQFHSSPTHIARAPGRINLIGEHTDYNFGYVLPAAVDRGITIAGRLRTDDMVTVESLDFKDSVSFALAQLKDKALPSWTNYLRGVLFVLHEAGHPLSGMDLTIAGDVPRGAGYSSSAAIELAMLEIACALNQISLTQPEKALLGQKVENTFIGIQSGVMDQMISAVGEADSAVLITCRYPYPTRKVKVPSGVTLMTLDTAKQRELTNTAYDDRVRECNSAAKLLGVPCLSDVTLGEFHERGGSLPDVLRRRALHVISENARTLQMVEALETGNMQQAGVLMNEGHRSLRDLYEVSIGELDIMAHLVQAQDGCYGARMMGGGFGGAVIALVADEAVLTISAKVPPIYQEITGRQATIYLAKAGRGSGARALE